MRHGSFGGTRKKIALGLLGSVLLSFMVVCISILIPNFDLGPNELAFLQISVPSIITGLLGFVISETYNEHSARQKNKEDE